VSMDIAEKYGLSEPRGALISVVGGPAKEAGLEQGDLITEFNGEPVEDGSHLKRMVAAIEPGKKVKIKVIRDGKEKEIVVKLGERTDEAIAELGGRGVAPDEEEVSGKEWMGMTIQELTDELAERLGYENQHGVLISDVDPDGPAAKVDDPPKSGDLIQEIELEEIKNMKDFREAIRDLKDPKKVMIRLRRASTGMTWYVVVKDK
jgi:serine protease Do